MKGKDSARRGADYVGPTPGAATRGVSTEADSGSRGGTGWDGAVRAVRKGRAQKFPAQLSLSPSSARARCGCSWGEAAAAAAAAAGSAQGAGRLQSGHGPRAVGAGSPVPAPPLEGGTRAGCRGGTGTAAAK